MSELRDVTAAFLTQCDALDDALAARDDTDWRRATPAAGWDVADQVAHLAWTDEVALLACADPTRFQELVAQAMTTPDIVDLEAHRWASRPRAELLATWREGRRRLVEALESRPGDAGRIPWFGPPMSARSMATARLMETWAHAQDVYDALGLARPTNEGLGDIAHLGVRTRDFAYGINDVPPPTEEFRIELTDGEGAISTWGPPDAAGRVEGDLEEFVLLVTQRRSADDLNLRFEGEARTWATIAQAFAGRPGRRGASS